MRPHRGFFVALPFICYFALSFLLPLAARAGLPADLQSLVEEALKANAEVRQMGALKEAAREAVKPAGALDDPEFAFILKDIPVDSWSFNKEDMTQKMLELSQKIPFPGKRRLRSELSGKSIGRVRRLANESS